VTQLESHIGAADNLIDWNRHDIKQPLTATLVGRRARSSHLHCIADVFKTVMAWSYQFPGIPRSPLSPDRRSARAHWSRAWPPFPGIGVTNHRSLSQPGSLVICAYANHITAQQESNYL
jgi:hypothetical protein